MGRPWQPPSTIDFSTIADDLTQSEYGTITNIEVLDFDNGGAGENDTLELEAWDAVDNATLPGYAIYSYDSIKVAVDVDITVKVI